MTKQNILKSMVIILSLCIVICTYMIFLKIFAKKTHTESQENNKEINLNIAKNAKVKQIWAENKKLYILITTPITDKIMIINEDNKENILTINLNKGDNKDE